MASFGVDFYLTICLMLIQTIVLVIFTVLYIRKREPCFQSIIFSAFLFLSSSSITLWYMLQSNLAWLQFFQGFLSIAALAPIVVFLEIFENGLSFTQRSSASMIFILVIGSIKGASKLLVDEYHGPLEVQMGEFFTFISPILLILVGSFYINTISKIKERVRFENQISKLRRVKTGIYLTFILPKFISGSIFTISILPAFIWKNFDINIILGQEFIFDIIVNLMQIIGIIVLSLPIIFSQSVFFMQSRKISKLIVISEEGIPVFEFPFELDDGSIDTKLLSEAYNAVESVMSMSNPAARKLKSLNFGDLRIMVEIRNNYAVLLLTDRPTLFLNKALESFANSFGSIFPDNVELNEIKIQKLKYTAEKMIQKSFGLEQEEFDQLTKIVQQGYDKIGKVYSQARSGEESEFKLLQDFMKRIPTGARILDAGCGSGEPVTRVLSEKFKVVGVDISKRQIDAARELLPYCEFVWQDMTTLTYPDEYFDGIVSFYAISHVPREEHKGLLENFHRMVKKGGYVLLCFGTDDDPGKVIDDFFGVKMYWSSFDAGTNVEMLKATGFHVQWLKLIFDDLMEESHIFVLAQKSNIDLLDEIKEVGMAKKEEKSREENDSST